MFHYTITYITYAGERGTDTVATDAPLYEALMELYSDRDIQQLLSIEGYWED